MQKTIHIYRPLWFGLEMADQPCLDPDSYFSKFEESQAAFYANQRVKPTIAEEESPTPFAPINFKMPPEIQMTLDLTWEFPLPVSEATPEPVPSVHEEVESPPTLVPIIIFVHGIGSSSEAIEKKFQNLAYTYKKVMDDVKEAGVEDKNFVPEYAFFWDREPADIFEIIDWKSSLQEDQAKILQSISPQNPSEFRNIFMNLTSDLLSYASTARRQFMIQYLADQMNAIIPKKMAKYESEARPQVALVGHSLGASLVHDLLTQNLLDFNPLLFMMWGSPVSLISNYLAETVEDLTHRLRVVNIIHPLDPISYLVEPLYLKSVALEEPAPVPRHLNLTKIEAANPVLSHLRRYQKFGPTGDDLSTPLVRQPPDLSHKAFLDAVKPGAPVQLHKPPLDSKEGTPFQQMARVDYVLQDSASESWSLIGQLWTSQATHEQYWSSLDCMSFLLRVFNHEIQLAVIPGFISQMNQFV